MHDENIHLRSVLRANAPDSSAGDEELLLPPRNGRAYVPHARPSNKPLYSLHLLSPSGGARSFQYVHLDSGSTYTAEAIVLRFVGIESVKVTILGRSLWQLYDYIHQHRIAWIMQTTQDFAQDGQTVVTEITCAKITPDE